VDIKWNGNVEKPGGFWTIDVVTNEQGQLLKSALEFYIEKAKKDMHTKYEGHPNYGIEDDMFLGGMIGDMSRMLFDFNEYDFPHDAV
jgi:hypothetical protein